MRDNRDVWRLKPNEYVASLISSEEPGTLAQQLREWNLIERMTAYADPDFYGSDGVFRIYIDLTERGLRERDRVVGAVFCYLAILRSEGVRERRYEDMNVIDERSIHVLEVHHYLQLTE